MGKQIPDRKKYAEASSQTDESMLVEDPVLFTGILDKESR
jgi:hypothetical protein